MKKWISKQLMIIVSILVFTYLAVSMDAGHIFIGVFLALCLKDIIDSLEKID